VVIPGEGLIVVDSFFAVSDFASSSAELNDVEAVDSVDVEGEYPLCGDVIFVSDVKTPLKLELTDEDVEVVDSVDVEEAYLFCGDVIFVSDVKISLELELTDEDVEFRDVVEEDDVVREEESDETEL
jgi:hypothetical protein